MKYAVSIVYRRKGEEEREKRMTVTLILIYSIHTRAFYMCYE